VACCYKGGVVLGADGRVSTGNYISNRASNKITRLTDNVYLLRSGSAADTQAVGDYGGYEPHSSFKQLVLYAWQHMRTPFACCMHIVAPQWVVVQCLLHSRGWHPKEGGIQNTPPSVLYVCCCRSCSALLCRAADWGAGP
jgi:20S proteasome subunit beta 1